MVFIKRLLTLLLLSVLSALLLVPAGLWWLDTEMNRPGGLAQEVVFTVAEGETLAGVAARLEEEGIITDRRLPALRSRVDGWLGRPVQVVKAGEYLISAGASTKDVMTLLSEGRAVLHRITLPEGLTSAQLLRLIAASDLLEGELPDSPVAEGSLLPDTYMFHRGMTRQELIGKMQKAQQDLLEELWPARQEGLPFSTPYEAVILASIVEKETGRAGERDKVAGLFVGRLKRGMRLQSDPTIIYGVSGGEPLYNRQGQRRTLYRSEIDRPTDWNTYQMDGLPRTPIANPGRDAIAAVLNPASTDYVFFVAECRDGVITGRHVFSRTNSEHNRAVAAYRECANREIARERAE